MFSNHFWCSESENKRLRNKFNQVDGDMKSQKEKDYQTIQQQLQKINDLDQKLNNSGIKLAQKEKEI